MQSMNFGKMFGKIAPGMCRLSMNGVAIKTQDGYKAYDVDTGNLVNCQDFVFDIGEDMFFIIPTNDVKKGDIILANGKPACVIEAAPNEIKAFSYETSTLITLVPEKYIFFGNTYFYSKIVSIFGNVTKGMKIDQMMPLMMMSEMMKDSNDSGFAKMLPMAMMMNGGLNFGEMFSGIFNLGEEMGLKKEEEEGK